MQEVISESTTLFQYNDGGREESGYKGETGDCGCRAIAIATGLPYQYVYDLIKEYGNKERLTAKRKRGGKSHPRTGIWKETFKKIMVDLGWSWTPTMQIGSGCKVHLKANELPTGTIICIVSRHYVAVIDGVIHDTYNPTRDGSRCVYGYFSKD
jgi:hypothetical protein